MRFLTCLLATLTLTEVSADNIIKSDLVLTTRNEDGTYRYHQGQDNPDYHVSTTFLQEHDASPTTSTHMQPMMVNTITVRVTPDGAPAVGEEVHWIPLGLFSRGTAHSIVVKTGQYALTAEFHSNGYFPAMVSSITKSDSLHGYMELYSHKIGGVTAVVLKFTRKRGNRFSNVVNIVHRGVGAARDPESTRGDAWTHVYENKTLEDLIRNNPAGLQLMEAAVGQRFFMHNNRVTKTTTLNDNVTVTGDLTIKSGRVTIPRQGDVSMGIFGPAE